jgi:hypothetical protein
MTGIAFIDSELNSSIVNGWGSIIVSIIPSLPQNTI